MAMVGVVAVNSLVAGNNKVPITSKIIAPSNARYEDILFFYCSVMELRRLGISRNFFFIILINFF